MESTSTGCKNKATDVERYYANKKTLQSQSDAPMDRPHVAVDLSAHLERREACPADVRVAACARHVVTACLALDRGLAAGAILDIVATLPFLEQRPVARFTTLTGRAFVILGVAFGAYPRQTRRALQDVTVGGSTIDLWAVRSRTVVVLCRP